MILICDISCLSLLIEVFCPKVHTNDLTPPYSIEKAFSNISEIYWWISSPQENEHHYMVTY